MERLAKLWLPCAAAGCFQPSHPQPALSPSPYPSVSLSLTLFRAMCESVFSLYLFLRQLCFAAAAHSSLYCLIWKQVGTNPAKAQPAARALQLGIWN